MLFEMNSRRLLCFIFCLLLAAGCATEPTQQRHNHKLSSVAKQPTIASQSTTPAAIALLLPESGQYAQATQLIKRGFKAAYQRSAYQPSLRFYDSANGSIQQLYQQAVAQGAELVVGPLNKDKIQRLALSTALVVPVLALNHIPTLNHNNLIQFGLSPIDEAMQVAIKARNDGHDKILLLSSNTKQGYRIASQLQEYWEKQGGIVLETQFYDPQKNDFSEPIGKLLSLEESKYRFDKLQRLLGTNIQYIGRRRQDVDAIFLAASPTIARSVYPQLRFYRATRIPVYSTARIYSGRAKPEQDIDLNAIIFCDIPWLFADAYKGELSFAALTNTAQQLPAKYIRLLALGIDSFAIIERLAQLNSVPYAGATGRLLINASNRITRQLVCAKFIKGSPVLQDFKAAGAS